MGPKKRGDKKRKATETADTEGDRQDESGGGEPSDHCKVRKGNLTGKEGKNKYIGAHVSISGTTIDCIN